MDKWSVWEEATIHGSYGYPLTLKMKGIEFKGEAGENTSYRI